MAKEKVAVNRVQESAGRGWQLLLLLLVLPTAAADTVSVQGNAGRRAGAGSMRQQGQFATSAAITGGAGKRLPESAGDSLNPPGSIRDRIRIRHPLEHVGIAHFILLNLRLVADVANRNLHRPSIFQLHWLHVSVLGKLEDIESGSYPR